MLLVFILAFRRRSQFFEHGHGIGVLRIQLKRPFIILDGEFLVAVNHIGFGETVVGVGGLRVRLLC